MTLMKTNSSRTQKPILMLLDTMIRGGLGVDAMQVELKKHGYNVPYRTLGRWINKSKQKVRISYV